MGFEYVDEILNSVSTLHCLRLEAAPKIAVIRGWSLYIVCN